MDTITIDGLDENDFRRSIETMLRNGEADGAATKLRTLLAPYSGPDKLLPARFLTVLPQEVSLAGWQDLHTRIGHYDRPDHLISALRIAVTDPDPEAPACPPDPSGRFSPLIETSYFSDDSFPFSDADRNDLLDGYSMDDSAWQGDFEAADSAVKVEGIEDLYGSVAALEARVMQSEVPDGDEIRAGSLGACFLAVLVHQAVRETVRKEGLPRALCVMAGNDGVYPFFDAPVLACDEYPDDGATLTMPLAISPDLDESEPQEISEGPYDFSRLSSVTARKVRKMPVIMLDATEADLATHQFEAGAAQQLADTEKSDQAGLLAVHDPVAVQIHAAALEIAPVTIDEPEPTVSAIPDDPDSMATTVDLPDDSALILPGHEDRPVAAAVVPCVPDVAAEISPQAPDHEDRVALPACQAPLEMTPRAPIRSLRARLTVEPEQEPGLADRVVRTLRRALAWLGLR